MRDAAPLTLQIEMEARETGRFLFLPFLRQRSSPHAETRTSSGSALAASRAREGDAGTVL